MTNILIADDHRIIRDGIKAMLNDINDYKIVSEASDGYEVMKLLNSAKVDVVIMDINMPFKDGIKTTQEIVAIYPSVKIIALSMYEDKTMVKKMVNSGAMGYIFKGASKEELINAIENVREGKKYFSNDVFALLLQEENENNRQGEILSSREIEILKLIAEEYTNPEIAEKLFLSIRTVDTHRRNLLQKLEVKNTAGLVKYAIRKNLL